VNSEEGSGKSSNGLERMGEVKKVSAVSLSLDRPKSVSFTCL